MREIRCRRLGLTHYRRDRPHQTCALTGFFSVCNKEIFFERHHNLVQSAHLFVGFQLASTVSPSDVHLEGFCCITEHDRFHPCHSHTTLSCEGSVLGAGCNKRSFLWEQIPPQLRTSQTRHGTTPMPYDVSSTSQASPMSRHSIVNDDS